MVQYVLHPYKRCKAAMWPAPKFPPVLQMPCCPVLFTSSLHSNEHLPSVVLSRSLSPHLFLLVLITFCVPQSRSTLLVLITFCVPQPWSISIGIDYNFTFCVPQPWSISSGIDYILCPSALIYFYWYWLQFYILCPQPWSISIDIDYILCPSALIYFYWYWLQFYILCPSALICF